MKLSLARAHSVVERLDATRAGKALLAGEVGDLNRSFRAVVTREPFHVPVPDSRGFRLVTDCVVDLHDPMELHPRPEAIVRAIVAMAANLRLKVSAESVETAEQLEMLREMNVHYAEG